MSRKSSRLPESAVFEAEAEFRATVTRMGELLRGENMIEARETLRLFAISSAPSG
jgi:hypothetical protein